MTMRNAPIGPLAVLATSVLLASVMSACGSNGEGGGEGPIRVGMVNTLSGASTAEGEAEVDGLTLAVEQVNEEGGLLGRDIELLTRDDALDASRATTAARDLILRDEVDVLFSGLSSASALAIQPLGEQYSVPILHPNASSVQLVDEAHSPFGFVMNPNTDLEGRAVGVVVAREGDYDRYQAQAPDYAYGRDLTRGFVEGVRSVTPDAEIASPLYSPIDETDYTRYVGALSANPPDVIFSAQFGAGAITFSRQAAQVDLLRRVTAARQATTTILADLDSPALCTGGEDAVKQYGYAREPVAQLDTPVAEEFIATWEERYDSPPNEWGSYAYDAFLAWAAAVEEADSVDGSEVAEALAGLTWSTTTGDAEIDAETHQALVPTFVGEITWNQSAGECELVNVTRVDADEVAGPEWE